MKLDYALERAREYLKGNLLRRLRDLYAAKGGVSEAKTTFLPRDIQVFTVVKA